MMSKRYQHALAVFLLFAAILAGLLLLRGSNMQVLNPKGAIAAQQYDLLAISTKLMLIVVIPVVFFTFFIAWRYRASNTKATYAPDWDYNLLAESLWWGVPCLIIIALAVITWRTTHELDPFKPLRSDKKPVTIQVVALQWKWLFIYPEHNIATINYIQFPEKTPINFQLTADAPMNSFWIPQLGGQIYAMPGMRTKLHLIADTTGSFRGSSANLSGEGFSGMKFTATSSSQADFDTWVQSVKKSPKQLDLDEYKKLVEPSENNPVSTYVLKEEDIYNWIVMKYMIPMPNN